MSDRETAILLDALKATLDDPAAEYRLFRSGKLEGLFPSRAGSAGAAANRAVSEGLLENTRVEVRGKISMQWVRLAPAGLEFLHRQESPVHALHELRAILRTNSAAVPTWLAEMRASLAALEGRLATDADRWEKRLDALARRVEETLRRLEDAAPPQELTDHFPWVSDALAYLDHRRGGGVEGVCPLPELFGALARQHSHLSVGTFHDGLRRLQQRRNLQLVPARDPSELVQPEYALLDGGSLLYYAAR